MQFPIILLFALAAAAVPQTPKLVRRGNDNWAKLKLCDDTLDLLCMPACSRIHNPYTYTVCVSGCFAVWKTCSNAAGNDVPLLEERSEMTTDLAERDVNMKAILACDDTFESCAVGKCEKYMTEATATEYISCYNPCYSTWKSCSISAGVVFGS